MPSAAGLSNFVRITAGAVGTSIFTTLWESRANMHHAHLAETINLGNESAVQTLNQLGAAGYSNDQSLAMVNRLIDQQAYTMAATDLFYLSSVLFVLMISVVWLTRPKNGAAMGDGGGAH
jgi:DHA2 family multidrug resistance protein